jgi:Fic family protein
MSQKLRLMISRFLNQFNQLQCNLHLCQRRRHKTPTAPQTQPSAQQNQTSFIRALLAKANAKLGSNRQKKLDKIMLTAQKKGFITNEQAQELLHCSDATATRYLSKLSNKED